MDPEALPGSTRLAEQSSCPSPPSLAGHGLLVPSSQSTAPPAAHAACPSSNCGEAFWVPQTLLSAPHGMPYFIVALSTWEGLVPSRPGAPGQRATCSRLCWTPDIPAQRK